jgi:rfaE bifunctional protein kinase chain/domain
MSSNVEINNHTIEGLFEVFNRMKVLVIGDLMIDSYIWGKVDRISPEAPVPIVHISERDQRLGGAANVGLNIKALGATPILCGLIGTDREGDQLLELLASNGMSDAGVVRSEQRPTTIKHRVISGSTHLLRIDQETDAVTTPKESDALFKTVQRLIDGIDVIVFEDYDKGVLNPLFIQQVIALAQSKNIPTVVDPKKRNFLAYKGCTLFKPNRKELKEGLKVESDLKDLNELEISVVDLLHRLSCENVLITLSEQGVYWTNGTQKLHIPAHTRKIIDVSGAGDTVISVVALCVAAKLPAEKIAAYSNLAGGLVCEHVGVVPIEAEALKLAIAQI